MNFPISRPDHIQPHHWDEWVIGSGVDPEIVSLNVCSLNEQAAIEFILGDEIARRQKVQSYVTVGTSRLLESYKHLEQGGWWVRGLDPLNDWSPMDWGQLKPDQPRLDPYSQGKTIKYEAPLKSRAKAFFGRVTWRIGFEIAKRDKKNDYSYFQRILQENRSNEERARAGAVCGQVVQEVSGKPDRARSGRGFAKRTSQDIHARTARPNPFLVDVVLENFAWDEEDKGFWRWVHTSNFPVLITEGAKKAAALLSIGYAAIGLPGITMGTRTKDDDGNPCLPYLLPELEVFAKDGREVTLLYDFETKPKTIQAIAKETEKLSKLLQKAGCSFKIAELPGPEKGVDDFVVTHGDQAFHQVFSKRASSYLWQVRRYNRLTFEPSQKLNSRYLGDLQLPEGARFVAIKSPKGTGKTESFIKLADEAMQIGQRVLLLSHRVQLAEAICKRIGLSYITEVRGSEEGDLLGYGLCVDSLHPESQARFNADYWHGALVIIDEVEQLAWHLLDATTEVSNRRTAILEQLQALLNNTLESDSGRLVIADADLSDISIELIHRLTLNKVAPHLVVNDYKLESEAWEVNCYNQHKADTWLAALDQELATGGKPFVVLQSQRRKSKYSTTALEALFSDRYPDLKILRIDSETISDPGHPAYQCTTDLNEVVQRYDCVLASPTIETGVSIDVRGHFSSVWGCLNGVLSENTARQSLARVREPVPRHIWVAKQGTSRAANGSSSTRAILVSERRQNQVAGKLLQLSALDSDLSDSYGACLKIWAKLAARFNAGMIHYRESVLAGLADEGHCLVEQVESMPNSVLLEDLETKRTELHQAECEAISQADDIEQKKFDELKGKKAKTADERHKERKFEVKQRYQVEVTPELIAKDDNGWYPKIRLHYFLGVGNVFLKERDEQAIKNTLDTAGAWLPTVNRSHLSVRVWLIEQLGIKELLNLDEEFNGGMKSNNYDDCHPALRRLADLATRNSWDIKNTLGVTVSDKMSPIQIAQTILGKIGIKLRCDRQVGGKGNRQRIYVYELPKDGRDEIFAGWFARDEIARQQREMHNPSIDQNTGRTVA